MHRVPLVGSLRKAKSLDGSHISVSVFGRYPPIDDVIFFVKCIDRLRKFDLIITQNSSTQPSPNSKTKTKRQKDEKREKNTHETLFALSFPTNSYPPSDPITLPSSLSCDPTALTPSGPPEPPDELHAELPSSDLHSPTLYPPNLKICTVSCAELTANNVETALKLIEYILASLVPLLN